ncbi:MAG: thermonuclease family protein, partial [Pseudomonadota bacterium]
YSRTFVNEAKGERWFCSEGDAVAAGWRAPRWN